MIQKLRRSRGGQPLGIWKDVYTIKLVSSKRVRKVLFFQGFINILFKIHLFFEAFNNKLVSGTCSSLLLFTVIFLRHLIILKTHLDLGAPLSITQFIPAHFVLYLSHPCSSSCERLFSPFFFDSSHSSV